MLNFDKNRFISSELLCVIEQLAFYSGRHFTRPELADEIARYDASVGPLQPRQSIKMEDLMSDNDIEGLDHISFSRLQSLLYELRSRYSRDALDLAAKVCPLSRCGDNRISVGVRVHDAVLQRLPSVSSRAAIPVWAARMALLHAAHAEPLRYPGPGGEQTTMFFSDRWAYLFYALYNRDNLNSSSMTRAANDIIYTYSETGAFI